MPNYCNNTLVVKGSKTMIQKMLNEIVVNDNISFDKIVPSPKTEQECERKYLFTNNDERKKSHISIDVNRPWFNWYDFNVDKWGTKWDASDTMIGDVVEVEDTSAVDIFFQTAWSPSIPIVLALQKLYPQLTITASYYECGMCYAGEVKSNGEIKDYEPCTSQYTEFLLKEGYIDGEEDDD